MFNAYTNETIVNLKTDFCTHQLPKTFKVTLKLGYNLFASDVSNYAKKNLLLQPGTRQLTKKHFLSRVCFLICLSQTKSDKTYFPSVSHKVSLNMLQPGVTLVLVLSTVIHECHPVTLDKSFIYTITYI